MFALAAALPAAAEAATPAYPGLTGGAAVPAPTQVATGIGSAFDITDSTSVGWSSVTATVTTDRGTLTATAGDSGATVGVASNTITISGSMASVENVLNSQGTAFARLTQATPGSATVTVSVSPSPSFTIGGTTTYFFSGNGHYYRINTNLRTWAQVNADAQGTTVAGAPGYAAVVRDQAEDDFVRARLLERLGTPGDPTGNQVWLGAERGSSSFPPGCTVNPGNVNAFTWVPGANAPVGDRDVVVTPACAAVQSGWTPWYGAEPANGATESRLGYFYIGGIWRWHDSQESSAFALQEFGSNTSYTAVSTTATVTASDSPYNTVRPSISGTAAVGLTLTADKGSWTASPAITDPAGYAYQWQRCESPTVAGVDWTTRASAADIQWRSIVWGGPAGGEKFVAVAADGTGNRVTTSVDGVAWTAPGSTPALNSAWLSVAWGGPAGAQKFVAVAQSSTGDRVMTSPDGINWTSLAANSGEWTSVVWGGSAGQQRFVAVGRGGTDRVMTSVDGSTWVPQTAPALAWRSVTWGGPPGQEKFVAVAQSGTGARVMTSPDGSSGSWTLQSTPADIEWRSVTWGGPAGAEKFVAVGRTGTADQRVMTSPDGITWTLRSAAAAEQWEGVTWGGPPGQGLFVAVGNGTAGNLVMTSPDGVTWTRRTSVGGSQWNAVAWGGPAGDEQFVAVGSDGTGNRVMTSSDPGCVDIPDAYASSYIAQPADYGLYLRVRVTASNGVAPDGVATSPFTAAVAGSAPIRLSDPTLFGLARVGRTITATPGVWTATPQVPHPGGYAYQWQRCVAGNGAASSFATATLNMPISIAVGADGRVFAGNGQGLDTLSRFLPDGTAASAVRLSGSPRGIAVDRSGNVYVADEFGQTVWKILPDGTLAGGNWPATLPNAALPSDIAIDAYGNIYTANSGLDSVSKISPDGTVVGGPWPAATGDAPVAIAIDSDGNLYTANRDSSTITRIDSTTGSSSGSAPGYAWTQPAHPPVDLAIAPNGDVYTVAGAASKMVSKFVYPDGSPAGGSWPVSLGMETGDPSAIAVGQDGSVYTANQGTNRFYKLSPSGVVAGGSWPVEGGSVGSGPRGLALDASGNLYSAAITSNRIIKIASGYSCTDISGATASTYVTQPADEGAYVRVKAIVANGVAPNGVAYSLPLGPIAPAAAETLVVNKYSPNRSSTPGCEDPDFTEIGSADPASGAVGVAASGDTIVICGSPNAATDPYLPNVTLGAKSLTFVGDGPDLTILDGQNDRTHFYANLAPDPADGYLRLEAMTITRGRDINSGGAIEAYCRDIHADDVVFSGNRAVGFGEGGGAIHVSRDGTCATLGDVSVANSTFAGNVAEHLIDYGEGGADGGAIIAYGSVTVTDSVFEDNEAKSTAASTDPARGGGDPGQVRPVRHELDVPRQQRLRAGEHRRCHPRRGRTGDLDHHGQHLHRQRGDRQRQLRRSRSAPGGRPHGHQQHLRGQLGRRRAGGIGGQRPHPGECDLVRQQRAVRLGRRRRPQDRQLDHRRGR